MFESFHPSFVCIYKMRETCCRNHVEFGLHLQSFKKVMAVLHSNLVIPSSTTQFVSSILCHKLEDSDEFKVQCIKNQCEDCGDLCKFSMKIENINESTPVSWMRYEYETYQNKIEMNPKKLY